MIISISASERAEAQRLGQDPTATRSAGRSGSSVRRHSPTPAALSSHRTGGSFSVPSLDAGRGSLRVAGRGRCAGVAGGSSALRSVRTPVCCVSCQREREAAPLKPQLPEGSGRVSHRDPILVHASPGVGGLAEVHTTLSSMEARTLASPSSLSRERDGICPKVPGWGF